MQSTEKILDPLLEDPVCGRHLTETQALLTAEHEGHRYLFCSERCRMLFALRPDAFALEERPAEAEEAPGR
jgi:Cu+-exporting ATPase